MTNTNQTRTNKMDRTDNQPMNQMNPNQMNPQPKFELIKELAHRKEWEKALGRAYELKPFVEVSTDRQHWGDYREAIDLIKCGLEDRLTDKEDWQIFELLNKVRRHIENRMMYGISHNTENIDLDRTLDMEAIKDMAFQYCDEIDDDPGVWNESAFNFVSDYLLVIGVLADRSEYGRALEVAQAIEPVMDVFQSEDNVWNSYNNVLGLLEYHDWPLHDSVRIALLTSIKESYSWLHDPESGDLDDFDFGFTHCEDSVNA